MCVCVLKKRGESCIHTSPPLPVFVCSIVLSVALLSSSACVQALLLVVGGVYGLGLGAVSSKKKRDAIFWDLIFLRCAKRFG